jgi:ribosomal protein L22
MIFGFNTDIKHQETVYHVQSEARESERLLQTQVFVKGRCIGKRAVAYAAVTSEGDDGDPHKEKMLREQHRQVLDAIREGKLDSLLDKRETPETLSEIKELEMEWLNSNSVHAGGNLMMHLRVTDGGAAVEGARLTFRFARPDAAPYYAQVLTDASGNAEMSFQVDEAVLAVSSVLVQASYSGRTATRKFRLRSTG